MRTRGLRRSTASAAVRFRLAIHCTNSARCTNTKKCFLHRSHDFLSNAIANPTRQTNSTADPTIKVFKKGKHNDYDGPRDAKGIVSFVKKEVGIAGSAGSVTKLKDATELKVVTESGITVLGLFREPVSASNIFKIFSEVASELPYYTDKKVSVVYSSSYNTDPVAVSLGVRQVPAVMILAPGKEPVSMAIPRKREEFTEDLLTDWIKSSLP